MGVMCQSLDQSLRQGQGIVAGFTWVRAFQNHVPLEDLTSCFASQVSTVSGRVRPEALVASESLLEKRKELFLGVLSKLAAE